MATTTVIEVDRSAPGTTRQVTEELPALRPDQVRLRVDRFAVTANTITYAAMGAMLGYWDFFPTGDERWGRVPAMGWADVVESAHPEVAAGGRYYGWFPLAGSVDLTVSATADGLRDDGPHRAAHAAVYRSYVDTRRDPLDPGLDLDDEARGDAEDRHALLRGLFLTGLLADAFFADQDYLGAEAAIVLSASSKTAIGFAQRAADHPGLRLIGLTSTGNAEFVRDLGWYDEVVTYDDVDSLPTVPAVAVDLAGDAGVLAAVHERLGDRLAYSMIIGKSHHDSAPAAVTAGPAPQFFFAPTEVARRIEEWGRDEYQRRCAEALEAFVDGSRRWLTVQRSTGPDAAEATWHDVYDGVVPPSVGRIASLHA